MGATFGLPHERGTTARSSSRTLTSRMNVVAVVAVLTVGALAAGCSIGTPSPGSTALRLQVAMTAEELATFEPALDAIDASYPEFSVALEVVPQGAESERITTQLASGGLPDVLRVQGAGVQQWIRRDAFADLTDRITASITNLDEDFFPGPLEQFRWNDRLWGLPDTASPEIAFWNRTMFEAAGLEPPTDDWTFDDMREAAIRLTLDAEGRHPGDDGFDPEAIEQWGWNGGVTYFWQNALIQARGGELCANQDCTQMRFTGPANEEAFEWWVSLVRDDHAALHDPYGGSQTGVPGDPFIAGRAAMGSNGAFAIGQLKAAGSIDFGVLPPFLGVDGERRTPLSTNGYVIARTSPNADVAWKLIQELTRPEFLETTWAEPGHAVPARRSAGTAPGDADAVPGAEAAIREAMEVGAVFRPYTANAGAAYGATVDLFTRLNTGRLSIPEGLAAIEEAANTALAPDRSP
jgi:multiple sugar transport system substrate-binding protein